MRSGWRVYGGRGHTWRVTRCFDHLNYENMNMSHFTNHWINHQVLHNTFQNLKAHHSLHVWYIRADVTHSPGEGTKCLWWWMESLHHCCHRFNWQEAAHARSGHQMTHLSELPEQVLGIHHVSHHSACVLSCLCLLHVSCRLRGAGFSWTRYLVFVSNRRMLYELNVSIIYLSLQSFSFCFHSLW